MIEEAKKLNKAFKKAENGHIYANVNLWINDEKDQYGNCGSIQLNHKDSTKEERPYFGNFKEVSKKEPEAITQGDIPPAVDDLPF